MAFPPYVACMENRKKSRENNNNEKYPRMGSGFSGWRWRDAGEEKKREEKREQEPLLAIVFSSGTRVGSMHARLYPGNSTRCTSKTTIPTGNSFCGFLKNQMKKKVKEQKF